MNILLIEDSDTLRRSISVGLSHLGFTVEEAADGCTGLNIAMHNQYDLIILDIMLPGIDGLNILETLRKQNNNVKIIILSAKNETDDKVRGLLSGADDYLAKPFVFDELHARVLALLRREGDLRYQDCITLQDFSLDLVTREFRYRQQEIKLTLSEYKIIELLFRRNNTIVSLETLTSALAGNFDYVSKNTIHVHISSIRKKIKQFGGELPLIHKRGHGYILENAS
ncbi:response regulator transcription factor [Vibrio aerogenes]|nr:response regulator transcription factor [Vibrio aerogenes]